MWSCKASPAPFLRKLGRRFNHPAEMERFTLFSWHTVLIWSLKNQLFLGFNCVLLIIKIAGLETSRPTFLREKFGIISWNRLIIFNGDMKCVLSISFLVQNLITPDNPIYIRLWWIWNSVFCLEVENLRKLATVVSYKLLPSALRDT